MIDSDYEYGDYAASGEESYDYEEEVDSSVRGGGDYEGSGENEVEEEEPDG